jgi:hypothetical protein
VKLPSLPLTVGRVTIHPDRGRSKDEYMGRFGGGWQYRLGLTAGRLSRERGGTILVGLLVREYRVSIAPRGGRQK